VPAVPARLRERYRTEILPSLMKQFNYTNRMQVPQVRKVVLNMGLGEAVANVKVIDAAVEELGAITGQKPVVTRARKSEAAFKLRAGMPIGCKVTMRGERMYEFLDRLLSVALPRIRDFRGVPTKSFDGRGNYALGIREQLIFPEIRYDKVDMTRGMDVCIETSAKTDEEARALLEHLGFPFRK
jgi:large subunit ribosomal protein L5